MKLLIINYMLRFESFRKYMVKRGYKMTFWFSQEEFISMSIDGEANSIYDLPTVNEMAFTDSLNIADGFSKQHKAVLLFVGTEKDIKWSRYC